MSPVHDDAHSVGVQEEDPNAGADADSVDLGEDEPTAATGEGLNWEQVHFDPTDMEEALQKLYSSFRCTKLAATILPMNLCTVHGVSNNCANELFTLLHGYILLEKNSLPKNFHATRSLTQKLGLSYNSIHACDKRCVIFGGKHAEAMRCP